VTAADALFDLLQPANPLPQFIDPEPSAQPGTIAEALEIEYATGNEPTPDQVNTAALAAFLDGLGKQPASGADLLTLFDVLRADSEGSLGLVSQGRARLITHYLQTYTPDSSDINLLLDLTEAAAHEQRLLAQTGAGSMSTKTLQSFISTVFAKSCTALRAGERGAQPAVLGLLLDAADADPGQQCLDATGLAASYRQAVARDAKPTVVDTAVMAELRSEKIEGALDQNYSLDVNAVATAGYEQASTQLAQDPSLTCPLATIRANAYLAQASGTQPPALPVDLQSCVERALRWHGALPEIDEPAVLSTAFAISTLRIMPLTPAERAMLAQVTASIDLAKLETDPVSWMAVALSAQPESVTAQAVARLAGAVDRTSSQQVALLAAASDLLGTCSSQTQAIIMSWLTSVAKPASSPSSLLWSIFAVHDASICAKQPAQAGILAAATQHVDDAAAAEMAHGPSSDPDLTAWVNAELKCDEARNAAPHSPSSAPSAPATPAWDDLVGSNPPSILDLYAQVRTGQITTNGCIASWITPAARA
jgi:hypothetical protein